MKKRGAVGTYLVLVLAVTLSKVLGLVRNMLLARFYGTTAMADAFSAASSLPLMIYDVTLGTAIASAFVPVFNEKLTQSDKKEAERFGSNFLNITVLIAGILAGVGILLPELAIKIVASGLSSEAMGYAAVLVRIILPVMCFATGIYIFVGILQSYGEFTGPALISLVSNLAMILYFVAFNRYFGIYGLGVAFTLGWVLQLLFLLPFLKKRKFHYSFTFDLKSPDIRRVLVLTLPLFVAALAQPINQLISTNISSNLGEGLLASVNYAYQAYFIVAGIFSYCLTNLFFPEMSRCFSRGDIDAAKGICGNMLGSISAIVLPIMAFLAGNSKPVVRLLYEGKNFTAEDTARVAMLLSVYCLAMLFYSYQEILNKYFYSMQRVKLPVATAFIGIGVNLGVSLLAVRSLGVYGLALGTLCAALVMAALLLIFTARVTPGVLNRGLLYGIGKDIVAAMGLFIAARELRILIEGAVEGTLGTALGLVAGLVGGLIVYALILLLTGSKELKTLLDLMKKRGKQA
ncbi:MAG: murein biosynthesis integral membrane protein MurJ [Clostridia bacterium]|nr:murein biosynthesis integral membrane protein MurJ [Clostridia bacterium]